MLPAHVFDTERCCGLKEELGYMTIKALKKCTCLRFFANVCEI
jgi:hypothetical protein